MISMILTYITYLISLFLATACVTFIGSLFLGKYTLILSILFFISYMLFFMPYVCRVAYLFDKCFPIYPPCESGCCRHLKDYNCKDGGTLWHMDYPPYQILTCKCGHEYKYFHRESHHYVLKLDSEGNEIPYMKYVWFRGWYKEKEE